MKKATLSVLTSFCVLACLMPTEAQAKEHRHKHNDGLRLAAGIVHLVGNGIRALTGQPKTVVVAPAPVVVAPAPVVVAPPPVVVAPPPVVVVPSPAPRHVRLVNPPPRKPPVVRKPHAKPVPPPHRGRGR